MILSIFIVNCCETKAGPKQINNRVESVERQDHAPRPIHVRYKDYEIQAPYTKTCCISTTIVVVSIAAACFWVAQIFGHIAEISKIGSKNNKDFMEFSANNPEVAKNLSSIGMDFLLNFTKMMKTP